MRHKASNMSTFTWYGENVMQPSISSFYRVIHHVNVATTLIFYSEAFDDPGIFRPQLEVPSRASTYYMLATRCVYRQYQFSRIP